MAWLALDLGWTFGYAVRWRNGEITSGFKSLRAQSHVDGVRLLVKTQWLTAKLKEITDAGESLDRVFHEKITFNGKANRVETPHAHGKQLGTLERWCALKGIREPEGLPWDEVKKFVTGHRSASSDLVLKTIQKKFPHVTDHNEASSVAVMLTAIGGRGE